MKIERRSSGPGLLKQATVILYEGMVWVEAIRVFFLDSFSPKTSNFSSTLVTLTQINHYGNTGTLDCEVLMSGLSKKKGAGNCP